MEVSAPKNTAEGTGENEPQNYQQQGRDKQGHMDESTPKNIQVTGENEAQDR